MKINGNRIINTTFKNVKDVVLWDIIPIEDGETVKVTFESKNSDWAQGIWLMCDKGVETHDKTGQSIMLWYESAPKQVLLKCHTDNGILNVYNIWDRGQGHSSQSHSSGMLVEELPTGRRYMCNDIGFETNFDKLIFKIERL